MDPTRPCGSIWYKFAGIVFDLSDLSFQHPDLFYRYLILRIIILILVWNPVMVIPGSSELPLLSRRPLALLQARRLPDRGCARFPM